MARKSLARVPLYPFALGRDFAVGEPLNGREDVPHEGAASRCRCPELDYSGADPRIQFPKDLHTTADEVGGEAGGFHQNCETFHPEWVRVMRDPNPKKKRNIIHADLHGLGKVEVSRWFDRDVWHPEASAESSGGGVRLEFVFRLLGDGAHYVNFEGRGELNFRAHKNEPVEAIGIHFMNGRVMVAYWRDAVDDARTDDFRKEFKGELTLTPKLWYRLTQDLTPTANADEWAASIRLTQAQKIVYRFDSTEGNHPNNILRVTQICCGKERARLNTDFEFELARFMPWEIV